MPTYLFIDDDIGRAPAAEIYAEALEHAGEGLRIVPEKPARMPDLIQRVAAVKPDGLLLDVAFTNALDAENRHVGFDGIAFAQQVRTLQTRGRTTGTAVLGEFPIVRFSKKDVIREYVNADATSDDLFDEMIDKGSVVDAAAKIACQLTALAADYPKVSALADSDAGDAALAVALGCEPQFLTRLDARTLLGLRRPGAPAHALARYFTAKLLARPGAVIDERLVSIRLGVDRERSEDWPALLESLAEAQYRGAFAAGYPRWWQASLLDWWQAQVDGDRPLARLAADERVQSLTESTGLARLAALVEDPDSPGRRYWHVCVRSGRPVDPAHGFPLMPIYGHESWHDAEYLCLEEARRDSRNPRLSPTERSRLEAMMRGDRPA